MKESLSDETVFFALCFKDKVPIGCGFGQIRDEPKHWIKEGNIGYVGLMFVEEPFRNLGAGQKILDAIVAWFDSQHITEIRLTVYADNAPAINSYRKKGFKDYLLDMRLDRSQGE